MSSETEAAGQEERLLRAMLADQEERFEVQSAVERQRVEALLAEERSQLAQERLERRAQVRETYRQTVIAQAVSSKEIAPVRVVHHRLVQGGDRRLGRAAKVATAEILAEVAGQQSGGEAAVQQDDPAQPPGDQYLPRGLTAAEQQAAEDGSLSMQDYARLRQRLGLGHRDAGIFN
jgi:hypothetical protein